MTLSDLKTMGTDRARALREELRTQLADIDDAIRTRKLRVDRILKEMNELHAKARTTAQTVQQINRYMWEADDDASD